MFTLVSVHGPSPHRYSERRFADFKIGNTWKRILPASTWLLTAVRVDLMGLLTVTISFLNIPISLESWASQVVNLNVSPAMLLANRPFPSYGFWLYTRCQIAISSANIFLSWETWKWGNYVFKRIKRFLNNLVVSPRADPEGHFGKDFFFQNSQT